MDDKDRDDRSTHHNDSSDSINRGIISTLLAIKTSLALFNNKMDRDDIREKDHRDEFDKIVVKLDSVISLITQLKEENIKCLGDVRDAIKDLNFSVSIAERDKSSKEDICKQVRTSTESIVKKIDELTRSNSSDVKKYLLKQVDRAHSAEEKSYDFMKGILMTAIKIVALIALSAMGVKMSVETIKAFLP